MLGFAPTNPTCPAAELVHGAVGASQPGIARSCRAVGQPVVDPSPATRKLYAGDWARFVIWCRQQHQPSLPANVETMMAYLLAVAPALSRGALGRRRAAIGAMHRQAGLPVPMLDPVMHEKLRMRGKPREPVRSAPASTAGLMRMAQACPRDLPGLRDRALLLLAAATLRAVPRLYLLGLDAEHLRFTASGVVIGLRTRPDQTLPTQAVTLTRSMTAATCPVRALEDWVRSSDTAFGPVFRKVDRWGNVEHGRLGPDAWHRILARRSGVASRRPAATPKTV